MAAALVLLCARAAVGWPEDSLPVSQAPLLEPSRRAGAVSQGEWAARLVEALGLGLLVPGDAGAAARFAFLCPGGAVEALPAAPDGGSLREALAFEDLPAGAGGSVRLAADVPRSALYRLVVTGRGPSRWSVDGRELGVLDASPLGVAASTGWIALAGGTHELLASAGDGARLDRVVLVARRGFCAAPAGGWQADRPLTFGDKARTLVHALGLEGRLPATGDPLLVEGEAWESAPSSAVRSQDDTGRPASGGAWARADADGAEISWRVALAEPALVSVLARVHGSAPQLWLLDRDLATALLPGPDAQAFGWSEVATVPLDAGTHRLRVRLAGGSGVDVMRLVPRRTSDADYVAVLEALGLREGAPDAPVSEDAAQRNLASEPVRRAAALGLGWADAGDRLALVESELDRFYSRPLSPVLPGER